MKIGDIVQLKSGGPTMTIVAIYESASANDKIQCDWFNSNIEVSSRRFPEDALRQVYDQKIDQGRTIRQTSHL